jgi:hypothetical protein
MPLLRVAALLLLISLTPRPARAQEAGQNLLLVISPDGQIVLVLSGVGAGSGPAGLRYSKDAIVYPLMVSGGGNAIWIHPAKEKP